MKVELNGSVIDAELLEKDSIKSSTGKDLRQFELKFQTTGEQQKEWAVELLKNELVTIQVPSLELNMETNVTNSSYSFRHESDVAHFDLTITEHDPEDNSPKSESDFIARSIQATLHLTADNWKRTRAIAELLIDKGVFTKEEYQEKLDIVFVRDHKEIMDKIIDDLSRYTGYNFNKEN